jgi:hypothetical protein
MMDVDLFLDPLADPEPVEDYVPTGQSAHLDNHRLALRMLEIQREQRELLANLYDVLAEEPAPRAVAGRAEPTRESAVAKKSKSLQ